MTSMCMHTSYSPVQAVSVVVKVMPGRMAPSVHVHSMSLKAMDMLLVGHALHITADDLLDTLSMKKS